jgi:hypothetical protein
VPSRSSGRSASAGSSRRGEQDRNGEPGDPAELGDGEHVRIDGRAGRRMVDHDAQKFEPALGGQGEDRGQVEMVVGVDVGAEKVGHMDERRPGSRPGAPRARAPPAGGAQTGGRAAGDGTQESSSRERGHFFTAMIGAAPGGVKERGPA